MILEVDRQYSHYIQRACITSVITRRFNKIGFFQNSRRRAAIDDKTKCNVSLVVYTRYSWPVLMAGTHGRYSCSVPMAGTHGRYSWPVLMAGTHGRYSWPVLMAGTYTAQTMRVTTSTFTLTVHSSEDGSPANRTPHEVNTPETGRQAGRLHWGSPTNRMPHQVR